MPSERTEHHDDLLEAWREAERAAQAARRALEAADRALVAAKTYADAVADTARSAQLALAAAERARNISMQAAMAAGLVLDDKQAEHRPRVA